MRLEAGGSGCSSRRKRCGTGRQRILRAVLVSLASPLRTYFGASFPLQDSAGLQMNLQVLFQVLWTLELFGASGAAERLQWHMDSQMRSNMVSFLRLGGAVSPMTVQL